MNKAELIDKVAERLEVSRKQAAEAVDEVIASITDAVAQGERVAITGFGIFEKVERAERVTVHYQDADGQARTLVAEGLLAVCIQHEMDHLMGKVFVEYQSPLKRNRIKAKMLKAQREAARA